MNTEDYIYCEECQEYVDFWKYGYNIDDTEHGKHKWRFVNEDELDQCEKDCEDEGCFEE